MQKAGEHIGLRRRFMKRIPWQVWLGAALVLASAILYSLHYAIFRDPEHIFMYMLGDMAFLPIEVLLVTLIIHGLLGARERREKLEKLNMVIGAFFSEVGTKLLIYLSDWDPQLDSIRKDLIVESTWTRREFERVNKELRGYTYKVDPAKANLHELSQLLCGKRDFLVRLLENPILLEHETFTDVLWAVFHLTEELACREGLKDPPPRDREHLAGDMKRAYNLLVHQWLDYMEHLKENYPYLFLLAMRTNPFDRTASPVIQ